MRLRNLALWGERQGVEQSLKQAAAKLAPSDPKRKQLEESLKRLDAASAAPEKLAGAAWVQPKLIDAVNTQQAILLGTFGARRDAAALAQEYAALRQEELVVAALKILGKEHRLGPIKDYAADLRHVNEYEAFVFSQPQLLYLQSGQVRISALLDDRVPVTFSPRAPASTAVVTASIAQAAGLTPEPNAPAIVVRGAGGRSWEAKRVTLASLRFGKHVLRNVEAFVLPPEGEDHGADRHGGLCRVSSYRRTGVAAFRIEAVE